MNRRSLLQVLGASVLAGAGARAALGGSSGASPKARTPSVAELQRDWRALLAPGAQVASDATPVTWPDAEWRKRLPDLSYQVLRHEATEHPFSSPLNDEHRPGVFVCAGCALPLFSSAMKFDSGTGWPSFFTTIPGVFATKSDHLLIMARTEYHCSKCGGHHGHVFDDGPAPTGLRYCNNGVALRFIPQRA
jgi:peptide-methionine (R)-S-oxide reductase